MSNSIDTQKIPAAQLRPLPTKPLVQSKELWGKVVKIIGAILAVFGISLEPTFLADGWQPDDLMPLVGFLIALVGALWEMYGRRAATQVISGIFRSKD